MLKPMMLDLFCGAGGASVGYSNAGFSVVGVDINPQPNYPISHDRQFVQADAFEFVDTFGHDFDFIHASPMCYDHSQLKSRSGTSGTGWQLEAIRRALLELDLHRPHRARTATRQRKVLWEQGWHISVTGNCGNFFGPEAMGIDWMTSRELCQSIPPAYTHIVGQQALVHLGVRCEHV